MMDISECLKPDTMIYLTRDRDTKKGLFYKDEKPELFIKDFNHAEFIGVELCGIRNLRCAHYFLVGCGMYHLKRMARYGEIDQYYKYKLASYDFKDSSKKYKSLAEYGIRDVDKFHAMLEKTPTAKNREELCHDMLELLALDIYMGQDDRTSNNVVFEIDNDQNIRLAPLFDFEYSLNLNLTGNNNIQGFSDLIYLNDYKRIREFIKLYPEFEYMLKSYSNVDLCNLIYRTYSRHGLKVPDDKWRFYEEFEDDRNKVLKKIVR